MDDLATDLLSAGRRIYDQWEWDWRFSWIAYKPLHLALGMGEFPLADGLHQGVWIILEARVGLTRPNRGRSRRDDFRIECRDSL